MHELKHVVDVQEWPDWPEQQHYHAGNAPSSLHDDSEDRRTTVVGDWKVFPFVYTFPADDPSKTVWLDATCNLCPNTAAILRRLPGIRTALYSRLGPHTEVASHRGWADLSNHILRCHLGLIVPTTRPEEGEGEDETSPKPSSCCGMVVGEEEQEHQTGEILVFDDSKLHRAYNRSGETRTVLIIDLFRPLSLPRGKAVGSHTAELDAFIAKFTSVAQGGRS